MDIVLIDAGWETDTVREAARPHQLWNTAKGFGYKQHSGAVYHAPKDRSKYTLAIGEGWHDVAFTTGMGYRREYQNNADHWKRRVHQALSCPADSRAALLLPHTDKADGRAEVAKQLTAEREQVVFEVGKGRVQKWVQTFSRNHLLDAAYLAFVGLSVLQFDEEKQRKKQQQTAANGVISGKKAPKFVRDLR